MTVVEFLTFIIYFILFLLSVFYINKLWGKVKKSYLSMIRADFYSKQKYHLLELTIPKGQTKSPLAMEVFLNALNQGGGESNWMDIWLKGSTKSWFSLELVSIEGKVHFYIWTN